MPPPRTIALYIGGLDDCGDLIPGSAYEVIPDADADSVDYLRVVDDSGEDYLYPAQVFRLIVL